MNGVLISGILLYVTFHIDHHPRSIKHHVSKNETQTNISNSYIYIYTNTCLRLIYSGNTNYRTIYPNVTAIFCLDINLFYSVQGVTNGKINTRARVKQGRWYFCPTGQTCVKYNVNYIIWQFHWLHVYISPNYALYPSTGKPHCSYALRNELVITRLRHVPSTYFSYNLSPCTCGHIYIVLPVNIGSVIAIEDYDNNANRFRVLRTFG